GLALRDQQLLHRLPRVACVSESHNAAVAVVRGPEPFQPQGLPGSERFQRGAAFLSGLDRRQPQLPAVGKKKRASVAHGCDSRGSKFRASARILRCRAGNEQCGERRDRKTWQETHDRMGTAGTDAPRQDRRHHERLDCFRRPQHPAAGGGSFMSIRRALPDRRTVLRSFAAAGALAAAGARAQSNWPDHPVRIIVPYPAGGSTDVLSRILAERMKEMFGQPFVIENRPGAGGNIGIAAVTSSPPDGYTIGAATIGHFAINQYLYSKMPYDAERDMIPASLTWELPNVFVVATDHCPAKSVSEFIAWAKQKGRVSYGSPVVCTSPHLSAVMFVKRTGLDAVHVPFRGAAQTIPAMLADDGGCTDHGRGRGEGFRRDILGRIRVPGGHAAPDRGQDLGRHEADCHR